MAKTLSASDAGQIAPDNAAEDAALSGNMIDDDCAELRWRDVLKIHSAADLFSRLDDTAMKELVADIEKHGVHQPVVLWVKGPKEKTRSGREVNWDRSIDDDRVFLLDGRNRLDAMEMSEKYKGGAAFRKGKSIDLVCGIEWIYELDYDGDPTTDPWDLVISLNAHRRHLTIEQKHKAIEALLKAKPERSDRATAAIAKVSPQTVTTVRRKLEATAQIEQLAERTGKDGRSRTVTPQKTPIVMLPEPAPLAAGEDDEAAAHCESRGTASEGAANEERVEAAIATVKRLTPEELNVFDEWYAEYRDTGATLVRAEPAPLPSSMTDEELRPYYNERMRREMKRRRSKEITG
jgi:hypothetical protein